MREPLDEPASGRACKTAVCIGSCRASGGVSLFSRTDAVKASRRARAPGKSPLTTPRVGVVHNVGSPATDESFTQAPPSHGQIDVGPRSS